MRILVSNLPLDLTEKELKNEFENYGFVISVIIFKDKLTGKSEGYGIVLIIYENETYYGLHKFNGVRIKGRIINVIKTERKRISRKTYEIIAI